MPMDRHVVGHCRYWASRFEHPPNMVIDEARTVIEHCRLLSTCSEEPGATTSTFLSPPMREVHAHLTSWMTDAGMETSVDAAGNLRGVYAGTAPEAPRLFIGSHLDTV